MKAFFIILYVLKSNPMFGKRLQIPVVATLAILAIPLVAMQFTDQVNWSAADFIVGGILIFGVAIALDIGRRKLKNQKYRNLILLIIVLAFLLIWAELAVGIFDSPFAGT